MRTVIDIQGVITVLERVVLFISMVPNEPLPGFNEWK